MSYTFYFNEIFPTYDDWVNTMKDFNIVNYEEVMQANFDNYVYKILFNQYYNVNVRYSTIGDFVTSLSNVYLNKFNKFLKQKELLDKIYNLTDNDILTLTQTLSNMANNPNTEPVDPTTPINYISAQTYQMLTDNKLKGYLNALESIPNMKVYNLLKPETEQEMGFSDLFMNVQPNLKYFYEKE